MVEPYIGGLEPTHGFAGDVVRCASVRDGRRCQLYVDHHHNPTGTPHAHGVAGKMVHRRYVEGTWHRWDDTNTWQQEPGEEVLAWCCLGAP